MDARNDAIAPPPRYHLLTRVFEALPAQYRVHRKHDSNAIAGKT